MMGDKKLRDSAIRSRRRQEFFGVVKVGDLRLEISRQV
jgi:hypothetical protein